MLERGGRKYSYLKILCCFCFINDLHAKERRETNMTEHSVIPDQYQKHIDALRSSLDDIIRILSKVENKRWRRKLAGMCILTLGTFEFPETNLEDLSEEEENYIG